MQAKGSFTVQMAPLETNSEFFASAGLTPGRMGLQKVYSGDIDGCSSGEMLTLHTDVQSSAGYVAFEIFEGRLHGKQGGFALQHSGSMSATEQKLDLVIVPDSGSDELAGIFGAMRIEIKDGAHLYVLDYELPGAG